MNGDDRPVQALEDYNEGHRSRSMGHYQQSIQSYLSAIKYDPEFVWASNNLAWVYATSHDSTARNGRKAVKHALYVCRKSEWHCWNFISTLAAAHAEAVDFDKAVLCSERVLVTAPPEWMESEQEILDCFRSGQPHRED